MQALRDGIYLISFKDFGSTNQFLWDEYLNNESQKENHYYIIKYNSTTLNYTIMSHHSHRFLGVQKRNDFNYYASSISFHVLTDEYLTEWSIEYVENNNYFTLELNGTGLLLEFNDQANLIQLNKSSGKDNQKVLFKPSQIIENGFYTIHPKFDSNLAVTFSDKNDLKKLILMPSDQTKSQFFWIQFDSNDGCYSIIRTIDDNCLQAENGFTSQSHFFNLDCQKWIISPLDDKENDFFIEFKANFLRLEVSKNCDNNSDPIQLVSFDQKVTGNKCQAFQLKKVDFDDEKRREEIVSLIEKADEIRTVKLYSNNSEIDNDMFINGLFIENLELPLSISELSEKAFEKCANIKTISCDPKWLHLLPNPLNVENIFVPEGVESISGDCFYKFVNLKFLSLPQSLKSIDHESFRNLYDIKIFEGDPKFVTFIHKVSLIKVFIPEYVVEIPEEAFAGCKHLRKVVFKGDSQLKTIQSRAFANCESLEILTIPETVNNISSDAFYGCKVKSLTLIFNEERQKLSMTDNLIIDEKVTKITKDYEVYCNIESLEIPLTTIEFEHYVLGSFKKLKYVKCNPNLLNYFNSATIKIVFIPDGIKQISKKDFDKLVNLKFVEIPESVDDIEENAFESCINLTAFKCGTKHLPQLNKKKIKTLVLNNEVKQINRSCFDELINLEKCELPESIKISDPDIFINCKKLMEVNIFSARALINNKISIKEGTASISKKQFEGWVNLQLLQIPRSVTEIEEGTFDDCKNLEYLICDPKWFHLFHKTTIKELIVPDYVTELNKEQFDGFHSLTSIELPNEIKINDPFIFDSCESLVFVQCSHSLFKAFSEKILKKCVNNKKVEYVNPVYELSHSNNSIKNDQDLNEEPRETSIDDLAEFDKNNSKYCHPIMNVRGLTYSGKIQKDYKPENTDLSEISKVCGAVLHEIYVKFNIIPKTSQFLAILRLADEILNSKTHGSIGQIPSGEGKTLIITVLSIILYKFGKIVDIVISNLDLARRTQKEQKLYFDLFGIESGILLISNDASFDDDVLKQPVIYSTLENYESFYLHSLFCIKSKERLFDVVLVDEIDKMFPDEFYSPLAIANHINFAFIKDIYEIVLLLHCWKTSEIIKVLNYFFSDAGTFEEENIQKLKDAALLVINLNKKIDYKIENDQIIKINPNIQWNEHIIKMIEIREGLEAKASLITSCQIDHHSYLNFFNKIAGVTGSFGTIEDEELLKKEYKIDTFKVLPHVSSQLKIATKNRPLKTKELYNELINEILEEREKGRPILVIFDSIHHVNEFLKSKTFLLAQKITGENPDLDDFAIENAGNAGAVTISTIEAINGIDIKLSSEVLEAGGLHVIVPMKMANQRMIEQAAGRSGRQGQPGSVTFYISENDKFTKTKKFAKENENLIKLEIEFSEYIKDNFPWILQATNRFDFSESIYPYAADSSFILEAFARQIILKIKSNSLNDNKEQLPFLINKMVQLSWSFFFTKIKDGINESDDWSYYKEKYDDFIKELNVWIHPTNSKTFESAIDYIQSKLSNENKFDYLVFKGTKIDACNIDVILPEKSPQISLMNGNHLFGKDEINDQLQNGSKINWYQILAPFCDYTLINIIGDKLIPKLKNDEKGDNENNELGDEEEDFDEDIVTLKYEQKETWEWIFYNIKNNNKKKKKQKKLLKSTAIPSFLTIDFVKKALDLSGDAYNGDFTFGKVIHSSEENDMFKPVFYCLEESNDLYVITRGSFSTNDWMTDFDCKEAKCEINGTNIYFHQGFYSSANYVLNSISSILENNYQTIYFIGHSYGASVSALLCLLTKSQDKFKDRNIYALAFGSAPSMSYCPPEIENCIFTFINGDDLIPSFCLFNTLNTAAKNHLSFQLFVKLCLLILKPLNNKWIKEFVYAIEQNFEIITDVIGILNVKKVKGVVFQIGDSKKKKLSDCVINESQLPNSLSISLTSLFNHFIDKYEQSFKIIQ